LEVQSELPAAPMIRLIIGSDYPVMRAGIRALLGGCPEFDLRPEVIVLEMENRDQEGLEIVSRLAAELPEAGLLVLSDDAGEALARECLQAGARGYLLRDVSPEEMIAAVRAVGQGLTVLHPAAARALLRPSSVIPQSREAEVLSERETEVLQLLAQGLPSKSIAARLSISEHTVKFHVGSILGKLGAASRTEAVSLALRRGLISL
jgi:DNA-binding NarL/FixJ family response regulator